MPHLLPMPPYPWQQSQWDSFVSLLEQERLAHALLIAGPEGLGGLALARAMGQFLLCKAPIGPLACGRCKDCLLLESETHPDLLCVQPEGTSSAIKVDQIRQVTEFMSKTAQQGGRKVIFLAPAEAMNLNAANALLKSLEEPTAQTFLLLVSPEPSRLLATIRSRCAKLTLTAPVEGDAIAWLNQVGLAEAGHLLADAGGQPLKVQQWFEDDFVSHRTRLGRDLQEVADGKRSPLSVAKTWLEHEPRQLLDCLLLWVQNAVKRQQAASAQNDLASEAGIAERLQNVPSQLLFRYWEKLLQTKKELQSQNNPNLELLLDELLLGWVALVERGRGMEPR